MIGKIPTQRRDGRSSFKDIIAYTTDHEKTKGHVWANNVLSIETAHAEMKAEATQNPNVKDPIHHFVLSWPAHEKPNDEQLKEAVDIYLQKIGADRSENGHQIVCSVHYDSDSIHIHGVLNRVHPETGRSLHIEWSFTTIHEAVKQIEYKQGWDITYTHLADYVRDDNGRVVVGEDGLAKTKYLKKFERPHERGIISQSVRDFELRSGMVSYSRYAQTVIAEDIKLYLKQDSPDWVGLASLLDDKHDSHLEKYVSGYVIASNSGHQAERAKSSVLGDWAGIKTLDKELSRNGPAFNKFIETAGHRDVDEERFSHNGRGFKLYAQEVISPEIQQYISSSDYEASWAGLNDMLNNKFNSHIARQGNGYVIKHNANPQDRISARELGGWARVKNLDETLSTNGSWAEVSRTLGPNNSDLENDKKALPKVRPGLSEKQLQTFYEFESNQHKNRSQQEGEWYQGIIGKRQQLENEFISNKESVSLNKEKLNSERTTEIGETRRQFNRELNTKLKDFSLSAKKEAELETMSEDDQKKMRKRIAQSITDYKRHLKVVMESRFQETLDEIRNEYKEKFEAVQSLFKSRDFHSFVIEESKQGNADARDVITFQASRDKSPKLILQSVSADAPGEPTYVSNEQGELIFTDNGREVHLNKTDPKSLLKAMNHIKEQYGAYEVSVDGNPYIKQMSRDIADVAELNVEVKDVIQYTDRRPLEINMDREIQREIV